ncbi:MAG TPA: class IV adenylate cyclase [Candidatus Omnitrophota bacterium]|nr:class IV adenylate cyclase [Candidatus Omnitrophota bacterium]
MKFFEIEQKYRLADPKPVRAILKKLGAKKISSGAESNEFFDKDHFLKKQKIALRLRRSAGKKATLTLKGPRLASKFTKRMEIETPVDYRATKSLLRFLGFKVHRQYTKNRESYKLGRAMVTVDYLEKFGWFLEIEAQPREIARLAKEIGLRQKDREGKSYLQMLFNWKH